MNVNRKTKNKKTPSFFSRFPFFIPQHGEGNLRQGGGLIPI